MAWDAKYFSADDREAALEQARLKWNAQELNISIRVVSEPGAQAPGLFLALFSDNAVDRTAAENMDGRVTALYLDGGVRIELYPSLGRGKPLSADRTKKYIQRKNITGLNNAALKILLDRGAGFADVAPAQREVILDQDIEVTISKDEMDAMAVLLPADPGGSKLSAGALEMKLAAAGVTYGVYRQALQMMELEQNSEKSYRVARGKRPIDGKDGYLTYHFRREIRIAPKILEDDRVDIKTLDLFEPVRTGQLLVTRTPPDPGEDGMTVTGKVRPPKPGKNMPMPGGKNVTVDDEKLFMSAARSGMVQFSNNTVSVSDVFTVKGDCDMGVGNIEFDGHVQIEGGVIQTITIRATGNITVGGTVESAVLQAGGDVVLRGGVRGARSGYVSAGGNVTARFIERCRVQAGGWIQAGYIVHSELEAGSMITVRGKVASVVGGSIIAGEGITVGYLGSTAGTATEVSVGITPDTRNRLAGMHLDMMELMKELDKLGKMKIYLEKAGDLDESKLNMYESVIDSILHYNDLLTQRADLYNQINAKVENSIYGKVNVVNTVYPGVKITIASSGLKIERENAHVTYRNVKGEITQSPCEAESGDIR